jgi:hypothetical protein
MPHSAHIASPRNATHCFMGGLQLQLQPERYVPFLNMLWDIDKIIILRYKLLCPNID